MVGTRVIVRQCDVSSRDSVHGLIQRDMIDMPEIRGVIHGAMVLKVREPILLSLGAYADCLRMFCLRK
jgi:hypothetical protein